jgi:hypothetical protein
MSLLLLLYTDHDPYEFLVILLSLRHARTQLPSFEKKNARAALTKVKLK